MKPEKLFQLLMLVNGVTCKRWDIVMKLVEYISQDKTEIKEKKWHDEWKHKYDKLVLSELKTWSTFEDSCVELNFLIENKSLICNAKIYDGDNFNGRRKGLRFTATIKLPDNFISIISNYIMWAFDSFLEEAYCTHLEVQKKDWIKKLRESILNKK